MCERTGGAGPDYTRMADAAAEFICSQVREAGASGVVFGLSGGIDSAVVAYLSRQAMGDKCLALLMPNCDFTPDSETQDGLLVAQRLGMRHHTIQIREISDAAVSYDPGKAQRHTVGNLNARIRAALLYYEAAKNNYLVVGTGDKSEYLLGYFTKYGDGACDMLPIADLYKTQVQALGRFLGVPDHIVDKAPGPYLWRGHRAADELGADYTVVDRVLDELLRESDADMIAQNLGVDTGTVERIIGLHRKNAHKRKMPPIAKLHRD